MKRKRLRIQELKIQSFITELDPEIAATAKGGVDIKSMTQNSQLTYCPTNPTHPGNTTNSWFPYDDASGCTKVTTTTGTTTVG